MTMPKWNGDTILAYHFNHPIFRWSHSLPSHNGMA